MNTYFNKIVLFFLFTLFSLHSSAGEIHLLYVGGNFKWQAQPSGNYISRMIERFDIDSANVTVLAGDKYMHKSLEGYNRYDGTKETLRKVTDSLQFVLDEDDMLITYIFTHGYGYVGVKPKHTYQKGRCRTEFVKVGDGNENDFIESEIKIRTVYEKTDSISELGLNKWIVVYDVKNYSSGKTKWYKVKYVSSAKKMPLSNGKKFSDKDVYIERIVDYLEVDKDQDGYISKEELGGNMSWKEMIHIARKKGYGLPDKIDDNIKDWDRGDYLRNKEVYLLDLNLDNTIDAVSLYNFKKINKRNPPVVHGTDVDNDGLIDGFDLNFDNDMDDSVSINECLRMADGHLLDDDMLASYFDGFGDTKIIYFFNSCFSGGFINDLSGKNRMVITASEDDEYAYGTRFSDLFWPKMNVYNQRYDGNNDGEVGMVEAFLACRERLRISMPRMNVNGIEVLQQTEQNMLSDVNWTLPRRK